MRSDSASPNLRAFPRKRLKIWQIPAHCRALMEKPFAVPDGRGQDSARGNSNLASAFLDCNSSPTSQSGLHKAGLPFDKFPLQRAKPCLERQGRPLLGFQYPPDALKLMLITKSNGGRAPCVLPLFFCLPCLQQVPFQPAPLIRANPQCLIRNPAAPWLVPLPVLPSPTTRTRTRSLVQRSVRLRVPSPAVSRVCRPARVSDLSRSFGWAIRLYENQPSGQTARMVFSCPYLIGRWEA